jgi:hypothetical protein
MIKNKRQLITISKLVKNNNRLKFYYRIFIDDSEITKNIKEYARLHLKMRDSYKEREIEREAERQKEEKIEFFIKKLALIFFILLNFWLYSYVLYFIFLLIFR